MCQLQEILWETTDAEAEVLQQIFKHAKSVEFDVGDNHHHADSKKLVVMKLKLDGYDASLCKTSWDSTSDSFKGPDLHKTNALFLLISSSIFLNSCVNLKGK